MKSAPVPHNRLTFGKREQNAVSRVIRSGTWVGRQIVARLENRLAREAAVAHGVAVGSGLAALRLALLGLGVGPGAEVVVPAYSCVALANAVLALGAKPRPADVQPNNWNLDPASVRKKLTRRTRAIIAVNTFGAPAPVEELTALGPPVIEDCAHGFGAPAQGALLGARGRAAVLSFYATKLIGAGEGGAVLTEDAVLANFIRDWRDYADKAPDSTRLNDKMTDLEAALALCQLGRLQNFIELRRQKAERYHEQLADFAEATRAFRLPDRNGQAVWYRYVVAIRGDGLQTILSAMRAVGVHADLPVGPWCTARDVNRACPQAAFAFGHLLSLPLYPTLTQREQDRVCKSFCDAIQELRKHGKPIS